MKDIEKYGLDLHCSMIIEEYRENLPLFRKMQDIVVTRIRKCLRDNNINVTAIESRIKTEDSLAGKLSLKGGKYATLTDLTDIFGTRVITFYNDDVDKISAIMEKTFDIDWKNSVDKRKTHELNSFGYLSLHYICSIPKSLFHDESTPELNEFRFELQMRTALQHVWANMYHDIGYKSGIDAPKDYLRTLNRLAGMLELADDEFGRIRTTINEYRFKVEALVKNGKFEEVNLDGDSFSRYLQLEPFRRLTERIAAINQAEIHQTPMTPFLKIFIKIGCKTLGDVERIKNEYSEDAYRLALHQIGGTDLDIVASNIGVQNLCIVCILKNGGGVHGLTKLFDTLNGESPYNANRAKRLIELSHELPFLN
ncbi:MAG: hypothetical protein MJY59_00675 [Bacteroidaceae bacterium]|nr:hypothetical protein [Bacteroidaceae bacterium]